MTVPEKIYSWTIAYLICHAHSVRQHGPRSVSRHTYERLHDSMMAFNDTQCLARWCGCFETICEYEACVLFDEVVVLGRACTDWLTAACRVCNVFIQFVYLIWAPTPRLSDKFDIASRPICHLLSALSKQMGLMATLLWFSTVKIQWIMRFRWPSERQNDKVVCSY